MSMKKTVLKVEQKWEIHIIYTQITEESLFIFKENVAHVLMTFSSVMWNWHRGISEILLVGELESGKRTNRWLVTDPKVSTISPLVTDLVMVVVY